MTKEEAKIVLDSLHPGEPVYVLRGAYYHSLVLVLDYAVILENRAMYFEATAIKIEADELSAWQRANPDKIIDPGWPADTEKTKKGPRPSYLQ